MSQPYVGQIVMFGCNFAPSGWMMCSGQLLPISENETLFNLIGTTYGGDGQETFALPNLQSRVPIHQGQGSGLSNYQLAESAGVETVTLTTQQIPNHTHLVTTLVGTAGNTPTPGINTILADEGSTATGGGNAFVYAPYDAANQVQLSTSTVALTGGNQPHENVQPILTINYCISLFGVFPSPT